MESQPHPCSVWDVTRFVVEISSNYSQGRQKDWRGPGQIQIVGPLQNGLCEGGLGAHRQEILGFYMEVCSGRS